MLADPFAQVPEDLLRLPPPPTAAQRLEILISKRKHPKFWRIKPAEIAAKSQVVEMPLPRRAAPHPQTRRQAHGRPRQTRAGPSDDDPDPDPDGAPLHRVERARRKSDLLAARVYVWREVLRLVDLAADDAERQHDEAVADLAWDRSREGRRP